MYHTTVYTFKNSDGQVLNVLAKQKESAFYALYRFLKTAGMSLEADWQYIPTGSTYRA